MVAIYIPAGTRPVLADLHYEVVDLAHVHGPQLVALPVEQVEGVVRSELDLDGPRGVLVEPLLDVNLVRLVVVRSLRLLVAHHLHLAPALVHDLDHSISAHHPDQGDGAQDDAAVDVGDLRT